MLSIRTNIAAMEARRLSSADGSRLNASLERLASGLRINSASDDAAGLAVGAKFKAQVGGLNAAAADTQVGINLLQTADGALGESAQILQRMRTLVVQAANDTLTASDRDSIDDELIALSSEVDRIATDTQFNTRTLLLQSISYVTQTVTVHHKSVSQLVLVASPVTFTFQVGANSGQEFNVTLSPANAGTLSVSVGDIDVSSASLASATLVNIDTGIAKLSGIRSLLGAGINRLQAAVSNLTAQALQSTASLSRIEDVDMASEASGMTRNQILLQSSVAMLAQANQHPASLLSLLQG